MSSSTSPQHDRMLAQQREHEPSMEEILASIRRIIADDAQAAAAPETLRRDAPVVETARPDAGFRAAVVRESAFREAAPRPAPFEPSAPLSPDRPANLGPVAYVAPPPPRAPQMDSFESLTRRLGSARSDPAPPPPEAAPAPEAAFDVSEAIAAAAAQDMAARATPEPAPMMSREADAAVAAQFGKLSDALMANNAQRLDEMTRQMLRPMLKSWLDDNLPVLVERLVRAEIERVARGGR